MPRARLPIVPYVGSWTLFAVLYALLLVSSNDIGVARALASAFRTILPAAVLGTGAWWLANATPRGERRRARLAAVHLAGALAYTGIWSGITTLEIAIFASPAALSSFVHWALDWQLLIGALVYGIIVGIAYLLQAQRRLAEQHALATRAELQALRAQLDPHFLFNTLNSVTALVRSDPGTVEDALVRFGTLLRYVLDATRRSDDDVPLENELVFIRSYLTLEQLRLGDRLRVVEDVDPEALDCVIPRLTVQPLVENAVRYAVAPRAGGGTIRLGARLDGDRLVLTVADDGAGADPAALRSTHILGGGLERTAGTGLGLALVRQRLAIRFPGANTALTVETAPGAGFRVRIVVPAVAAGSAPPIVAPGDVPHAWSGPVAPDPVPGAAAAP